jgi:carboxymethylenebutenolidase
MSEDARLDVASVLSRLEVTRRRVIKTGLAAGFALAVQPIAQATIATDDAGLTAGEVKVKAADLDIPAYRAMPAKGGPFPVVLVVQEIFGVHEHIKDLCRRFAKLGYFAIAPELYVRQGDVSQLQSFDDILKIVQQVPDAQVMSDLDAAVEYAKGSGNGDVAKLGVTGFCWGGRIVWLYAAHSKRVKAAVAWYGRLTGGGSELSPKQPIDIVAELNAPVLGLYGGKDTGISQDSIEQVRGAAKKARVPVEIVVYPDAQHGFNADYRPSYNEKDARDGWTRLQAWFKKYGVA